MDELSNFSMTSDYLDELYNVNSGLVNDIDNVLNLSCIPTIPSETRTFEIKNNRYSLSKDILKEISSQIIMVDETSKYFKWLNSRKISPLPDISATDMFNFSDDILMSLRIIPDDHILEDFGPCKIDGIVFKDTRGGQLFGICVRNCSTDLNFVSKAKYSFTDHEYFLYGVDDISDPEDEVYIVEGVFDAIAMRLIGKQAIAIGSSHASSRQLAFIIENYPNTVICFDNDIYGMAGAAEANIVLGSKIMIPVLKDPYEEVFNGTSKFKEITPLALNLFVCCKVSEMKPIKDPIRDLRYNKK